MPKSRCQRSSIGAARIVNAIPTAASRQPWLARPRTRSSASMPKAIAALSVTPAYVITWGAIQNESRPMRRCQRMSHWTPQPPMAMAIRRPTKPAMLSARSPAIATVGAATTTRMLMAGHSTALCWLDGPGVFEADARAHHLRRRLRGPRPRPAATLPRRPHGVAIVGATAMVVAGVLDWNAAVAAVDARTLALLFGMMIVAAYLRLSGFFGLVTTWAMRRASTPVGALAAVVVAAGTLSALFVNDVICVVMAPLVVDLTRRLGLPPVPYLIALATAANVGSVATLTANPKTMLFGGFAPFSSRLFLLREARVALVGLGCVFVVVWLVSRRQLPPALGAAAVEPPVTVHYPLMIKTVVAVLVMLAAFLGGVPIAIVAIAGAAATLLTRRVNPNKVYREIDWKLLVLFTGLFVLTGGAERTGLADAITTSPLAAGLERPAVLTAVTAVLSNLGSNVPAVLVF